MSTASTDGEENSKNVVAQAVAEDTKAADAEDIDIEVNGEKKKGSEVFVFPVSI